MSTNNTGTLSDMLVGATATAHGEVVGWKAIDWIMSSSGESNFCIRFDEA
jgi:hypothetical protein